MLTFADFCAGIGGFRLGLEKIGWNCVYSCELDTACDQTYTANFGHRFDAKNIFEVSPQKLPDFDVLCAGFPCQPFSIAGKQAGYSDPRSNVMLKLVQIIAHKKPPVIFLENVANFVSHANGDTFNGLMKQLNGLGYDLHHAVLDSALFGVPQSRRRVYIVGFSKQFNSLFFSFTHATTPPTPFRPYIAHGDYTIPITDKWETYIDYYSGKVKLDSISFPVPKTRLALERINAGVELANCVMQMRSSGIRACSIDAPLPTFAVSHSGGGAMIPVYTGERRHLNLTEMKRIMGFPDIFNLDKVSRTNAIKQLSNAVCPPVITSIGQDIARFMVGSKLSQGQLTLSSV
jgi:DNA (cytosine-5)-methyltransferase 1